MGLIDSQESIALGSPAHGTLTINANGSFNYIPVANFSGSDSFIYQANDGGTNSNIATVTIAVVSARSPRWASRCSGQIAQAVNMLQAFINQVNSFISGGTLTAAQGQPLINTVNVIIASLNNGSSVAAASMDGGSNSLRGGAKGVDSATVTNRGFLPVIKQRT